MEAGIVSAARTARRLPAELPPMWRVRIRAHDVHRWRVPERVAVVPALTAAGACALVAGWAAADAGVPALRSLTAVVVEHTTAEPARDTARLKLKPNDDAERAVRME